VFRKALLFLLGEDQFTISFNVKLAASADNDPRIDTKSVFDCGRQTGGLWEVVSNLAVAD